MSRFDSHPSIKELLRTKAVPFALVGSTALGLSACAADTEPKVGDIVCTNVQEFTAQPSQTFSDLIAEHTDSNTTPADFPHLQFGIESEYLEHNGDLPNTFIIPNGTIDTPHVATVAGKSYEVPTKCDVVK